MITVFTPTYNRADLLPKLYESLCAQTFKDFEWLIVDDGSTDKTESFVKEFISCGLINIRYFKQTNGGKHRAINRGIQETKGDLFFIVDSDDTLPSDSLMFINSFWQDVKSNNRYAGVVGFMAHHNGEVIGHGYDFDKLDCNSLDLRYKYNVKGDMAEVFRVSVLKEFSFPEFEGERFCPEALVWNRISQKYIFRHFNKVIYYRDYLENGLTAKIDRIRMESPIASVTHYKELNSYKIPFKHKLKAAINYWRFYECLNNRNVPKLPIIWIWCRPIGFFMHKKDIK